MFEKWRWRGVFDLSCDKYEPDASVTFGKHNLYFALNSALFASVNYSSIRVLRKATGVLELLWSRFPFAHTHLSLSKW